VLTETRCGPAGGVLTCAEDQAGCRQFGPEIACSGGLVCRDGACTCGNPCDLGEVRCTESGLSRCERSDADGCLRWSSPSACPEGQRCAEERCVCENPCTAGQTVCGAGGLSACLGPDDNGCFRWGPAQACPFDWVCMAEESQCRPNTPKECFAKNECRFVGEKKCQTIEKYRQCKLGYDGCLVYDCST
jgi:hypothetical protein